MRENRLLAIAFIDLASSTRMYRELGDARARELNLDFCNQVGALLPRFGGRLVKTLGDGVMCAFADAESAVLAASALHVQLAAVRGADHRLRVHSGISVGTVIVEGQDVFGTIVNVAAYLAAIARTDQILASQSVVDRLAAPARACARAAYSTRLKGEDHPSVVHEILWQTDEAEITNVNPRLGVLPADDGALQLVQGPKLFRVNAFNPRLSLGRGAHADVVVGDGFVSRDHAVIEVDTMRFMLTDSSANGTYVAFDGSPGEVCVLRGETALHGSGRISLGRSLADPQAQPLAFRRDQRALYRV